MIIPQISWGEWLTVGLVLLAFYLILIFVVELIHRTSLLGRQQAPFEHVLQRILLIYEPLVVLLLGGLFIMINPILHGLIIGALFIGTFAHIRNYMCGILIQFDNDIKEGNRLKSNSASGIIAHTNRIGLKLRTNKGLQFINYSKLLENGYMLLSGEEVGGFYALNITPLEEAGKINHLTRLFDLLTTAPYLDSRHKPELTPPMTVDAPINARVMVKEERHLYDLMTLIKEWGYQCKLTKK